MADTAPRPDRSALDRLAYSQEGLFTASQAAGLGFSAQLLAHHIQSGRLERVRRGLYRLRDYPVSSHEQIRAAWLPMRDRAVVSHESALEIHGLSDVLSDRVHLTVPRASRGSRVPAGVVLHTTTTPPSGTDISRRDGLRVTAPARTIIDAANDGTAPEQIASAIAEALERGMTTSGQLRRAAANSNPRVAHLIARSLDEETGTA